jgi:N-formylglutamate amidohydrolase
MQYQSFVPENGVYYSGGYITQHHGNSDNILDAIQLETPSDLRTKDTIRFGFILGRIISTFYHLHYCDFPNKRRHA